MRWIWVLVVTAACSASVPRKPHRPTVLTLEETAMWFMRAALSGDDATARKLTLPYYMFEGISEKPVTIEEWDAEVKAVLDRLAREGDESGGEVLSAKVIEQSMLAEDRQGFARQAKYIAFVQYEVREADGRKHPSPFPWVFIKTREGWKFSPKK